MKWFKKNKSIIIVVFLVLILLVSIGMTSQGRVKATLGEGLISEAASPIEKFMYNSSQYIKNTYNFFVNLHNLQKRNEELEDLVGEYEIKIADYNQKIQENKELLELLEFKDENSQYELISASVIGIDPYKGFQSLVIDKGSANGVENDMTVVLNQGLVGRVTEVSLGTSKVLSVINTESMVNGKSVRTNEYVRVIGDNTGNVIGYIDFDSDIVKGDIIVTSGLAGVFPESIVIGKVDEVVEQEGKLEKMVKIDSSVDIEKINKVLIIK